MPLTKYPTCNGDVSTKAVACPKCGHPLKRPAAGHSRIIVWGAIFSFCFVYFLMNARLF